MPKFEKLNLPTEGELITFNQGKPNVPNNPIVPYIRGDGTWGRYLASYSTCP